MSKRPAQIVAVTLAVLCPYCGAEQPAPDNGSDAWLPEDITKAQGMKVCVDCEVEFLLSPTSKAQVDTTVRP